MQQDLDDSGEETESLSDVEKREELVAEEETEGSKETPVVD